MSKSNYSSAAHSHSVPPGSVVFRSLDVTLRELRKPTELGNGALSNMVPTPNSIHTNSIHLWTAETTLSSPNRSHLEGVLLPDELERAGRFRFDRDRLLFLTARGMLRILLGRYLNADPRSFRFTAGEFGKPLLASSDSIRARPLEFNVAHSGTRVLLGFAHRPVGVDLELAESDREFLSIARRYFSPREQQELSGLPPDLTARGFYNAWSRKEAFLKASGIGLSQNLDTFDVSLDPRLPAALLEVRDLALAAGKSAESWQLADLAVDSAYSAAVVYNTQAPETPETPDVAEGIGLMGFSINLNQ